MFHLDRLSWGASGPPSHSGQNSNFAGLFHSLLFKPCHTLQVPACSGCRADALSLSPRCTGRAVLSQPPLSLMGSGSELVLPSIPGSGSSLGIPTEVQPNTEQQTDYTAARCNGYHESLIITQRCPLPAGPGSFLR